MDTGAVTWRPMGPPDLGGVGRVGDAVHPDHPEDAAVIAERLLLYPAGCFVLDGDAGVQGYVVAHPWVFGRPPALNTRLGELPVEADTFYIHDLAIAPGVRGGRSGTEAVEMLARHARLQSFTNMSLVAVGSSPPFWRRNGFDAAEGGAVRMDLATYKGAVFMVRALP